MEKGAIISDCGNYRFQLWRIWNEKLPKVFWVMHNPATADAYINDPTIRRCINFSATWGYGGIFVGNLFSFRATNPKELKGKPLTEIAPFEQLTHFIAMLEKCDLPLLAFGNPVAENWLLKSALKYVIWHYLKLTKDGNPCHPLYLKKDLKPKQL